MTSNRLLSLLTIGVLASLAAPARSQESVGTLTLDGLSFISFDDRTTLAIPPGASLRFHFGKPNADGSTPFTLAPSDVSIPTISLEGKSSLTYRLESAAQGILRVDPTPSVDFTATVSTTLDGEGGSGTATYTVRFTTGIATATNTEGTKTIEVEGMPLARGVNHVQLVGATTNRADAFLEPGVAAYTVLSGTFDRLPTAP